MPTKTTATLLALALAGCAARTPASADRRDCFDTNRVTGWENAGASHVLVRVNGRDPYDLELQGPRCEDVAWSPAIAIESNLGSPWVCVGEGVGLGTITFRDGPGGQVLTCRIAGIRRPE